MMRHSRETVRRQKRRVIRAFRLGALLCLGLTILMAMILFSLGPAFVAKRFNPVSATRFQPLQPSVQALHQSLTVADLHADSLLWGRDLSQQATYGHVDIPRLIQGNVALQVFTVVTKVPTPLKLEGNSDRSDNVIKLALLQRWPLTTWFSLSARALYQAKRLQKLERKVPEQFQLIKTRQDLARYLTRRKRDANMTAALLGLEGAHALEGKLDNVDRLHQAGFSLIGLAHFFDNQVSGSAHGITSGGLTDLGRQVIERMETLHMVIDLAHASAETIDQVLAIASKPVMVSHTGVKGTCNNPRNLSDRQLQKIAQGGGLIGIGFWKTAVCGEDVSAIIRAIQYVVDQIGVDYVALGSDFDGAVRVPFDVAHINQITHGLVQAGFSEADIQKIMGMNMVRFLTKVLPDS